MICNGGKTALMLTVQAKCPSCVKKLIMGEVQEENCLYSHKCAHFKDFILYSPSTPSAIINSLYLTITTKETCMSDDAGWLALFYLS